jgi:hypothetical protein
MFPSTLAIASLRHTSKLRRQTGMNRVESAGKRSRGGRRTALAIIQLQRLDGLLALVEQRCTFDGTRADEPGNFPR